MIELHAIAETRATIAPLNPALTALEFEAARAKLPLGGISLIDGDRVERSTSASIPDRGLVSVIHGETTDPLALLWTSGSSGDPRGVLLTASALWWHVRMVEARLELRSTDHWAATLSPAHVGGLVLAFRAPMLGCMLEAGSGFDAASLIEGIEHRGITHASLVPTMLRRLLDGLGGRRIGGGLRAVLVGGAAAPPELLREAIAAGLPVAATWGMSEMTSQVSTATPAETAAAPDAVGRPLNGLDVRTSAAGELEVRGPTLAAARITFSTGGATSDTLVRDGWYATGDLGSVDDDGVIRVHGRRGLRIISGGVNVDPAEVERALRDLPSVADAVVVGLPDVEWGERVAALVIETPAVAAPTPRPELARDLRDRLAAARRPRLIVSVPALPLNANGKVDRLRATVILDAHRREPLDG